MLRHALIAAVLSTAFVSMSALAAQVDAATDQVKLGERLVNQSCVVCHFAPQITSGTYAPALSKDLMDSDRKLYEELK